MSLKIVVCVKTIIQLTNVDLKNRTLTNIRSNLSGSINRSDLQAVIQAVEIKSRLKNATITVISMGPASTKETLQNLYAYGVDQVILLSDLAFAGADTLATAAVLAAAIKKLGLYDLVLCGKMSEDGGTGQVGPEIAEILGIPHAIDVQHCEWGCQSVVCERYMCMRKQIIEMTYPCMVIIDQQDLPFVGPTLQNMVESMYRVTTIWDHTDIGIDVETCGKKGSATKVRKLYLDRSTKKENQIIQGNAKDLAQTFVEFIRQAKEKQDSGQPEIITTSFDSTSKSNTFINMDDNQKPIWVYIEHTNANVADGTNYLLQKGEELSKQIGSSLTAIVVGYQLQSVVEYVSKCRVDKILVLDHETLKEGGERELTQAIAFLVEKDTPQIILFGATAHGRSLAPRLAAKLRTGLTADCLNIKPVSQGNFVMTRPAYSGRILAEIVNETFPVIATLRLQKAQPKLLSENFSAIIPIYQFERSFPQVGFHCISQEDLEQDLLHQDKFSIVFGVGAGINHPDILQQFDILSARLHANIMASREAVTRGWMASKSQVGISGRSIAPTIYVACGISGAVQHMLGVQEAKYIIAINNNMDAPIFNYASLGLVGDIKEVLPAILEIIHIDSTVLSGGNQ